MEDSTIDPVEEETPAEYTRRLGMKFENIHLLHRALTHRSFLNENPHALEDNERLEFLGDAVLDFLVAEWLYNRYPEMSEGPMTRLRAALVGREQLAEFAREIDLGPHVFLGRGEADAGGRERDSFLSDSFEALIGAYHLDQGLDAVRDFLRPMIFDVAEEIIHGPSDKDPKSLLQEEAQARGQGIPVYKLVEQRGPDHDREFVYEVHINGDVLGTGAGRSKQEASKMAAQEALEAIGL